MKRFLLRPFFILLIFLSAGTSAFADMNADIGKLSAKSTKTKIAAIERLVATGEPKAVAVMQAFLDGNLFIKKADKKIVIGKIISEKFTAFDPITGDVVGPLNKSKVKKLE